MKISPDKATNSLVIVGTGTDYTNLIKVIEQLDVPRRQVFVEAVIMEVNLYNELDFGGASHGVATPNIPGIGSVPIPLGAEPFADRQGAELAGRGQSLPRWAASSPAFRGPTTRHLARSLNVSFFPSFARAAPGSPDLERHQRPLHAAHPDERQRGGRDHRRSERPLPVRLQPGRPGRARRSAGAGRLGRTRLRGLGALGGLGSLPIGQIQRQNVELKLKLKPQINEGDYIRMTIDESTEEIASTDPVLGPTTSKRSAKTVIVAKDQETVVIGGLMQDRVIKSSNKTPLLGDIPRPGLALPLRHHHEAEGESAPVPHALHHSRASATSGRSSSAR